MSTQVKDGDPGTQLLTRDDLFRMLEEADVDRRRLRLALKPFVDAYEARHRMPPNRAVMLAHFRQAVEAYQGK